MSSIQFFNDNNCLDAVNRGNVTGPPDGYCTPFSEFGWKSFRVVTLERTCAVTIYDGDIQFCSSSTLSVANFGACMQNNTVNQFSVDCQDYNIATSEPPASFVAAPTRSTSPSSAAPVSTTEASGTTTTTLATATAIASLQDEGLSAGAKAGIGIGAAAVFLLFMALIGYFVLLRRREARARTDASITELPGNASWPREVPPYQEKKSTDHSWIKPPATPVAEPIEAPGDQYFHGPHEMESPTDTPGPQSSHGPAPTSAHGPLGRN